MGKLNIRSEDASHLGLQHLDEVKLKLIAASLLSKPTSPTEAALNCMQIPTITRSETVHYVDSSPPSLRQHIISRNNNVTMHPVDIYCERPSVIKDSTFYDYHRQYVIRKPKEMQRGTVGHDLLGNRIAKCERVVRFIDYTLDINQRGTSTTCSCEK